MKSLIRKNKIAKNIIQDSDVSIRIKDIKDEEVLIELEIEFDPMLLMQNKITKGKVVLVKNHNVKKRPAQTKTAPGTIEFIKKRSAISKDNFNSEKSNVIKEYKIDLTSGISNDFARSVKYSRDIARTFITSPENAIRTFAFKTKKKITNGPRCSS
mgnify:FL=1